MQVKEKELLIKFYHLVSQASYVTEYFSMAEIKILRGMEG
jgi:hypothetical protein